MNGWLMVGRIWPPGMHGGEQCGQVVLFGDEQGAVHLAKEKRKETRRTKRCSGCERRCRGLVLGPKRGLGGRIGRACLNQLSRMQAIRWRPLPYEGKDHGFGNGHWQGSVVPKEDMVFWQLQRRKGNLSR